MRILGLDIGDRTIGIAVSDPLGLTAQGITTIKRKSIVIDIEEIAKICNKYDVESFVSGLPKNMNGTIGPQGEKVQRFCEKLRETLNLEVKMWDERLTTVAANRIMLEGDLSRSKRKKIVDKIAATFILQGYLDSLGTRL
ncbi:Holliday junction resolvase RuvX [Clostridium frigoris]|uniref:Putative pre-16S rRNA nuclease n=1 Tax=Clostridium frigoris TaxID=205327 RepID=A0ABS6BQN9_9CLOT|nr:Holliday junction resolvase RuvX [Clostridium frigoris]MBU3158590.1 Holliday junction resolvase RuvX [Clostridium frigoris]